MISVLKNFTRTRNRHVVSVVLLLLLGTGTVLFLLSGLRSQDTRQFAAVNGKGTVASSAYPGMLKLFGSTTAAFTSFPYKETYLAQEEAFVHSKGIYDNRVFMNWQSIQPNPTDKNVFDFSTIDLFVKTETGDSIIGVVGNNMLWNQTCTDPASNTTYACDLPTENIDIESVPKTRTPLALGAGDKWSDWDVYIYKTVSRYGSQSNNLGTGYGQNLVHTWEIMNEMDYTASPAATDYTARGKAYGQLLNRTIQIVNLADPSTNVKILSGGIGDYLNDAYVGNTSSMHIQTKTFLNAFLQQVKNAGNLSKLAGVSFHPYIGISFDGRPTLKAYLDSIDQEVTTAAGQPLPIWLTEVGFNSDAFSGIPCFVYCQTTKDSAGHVMAQNLTQILASKTYAMYWFLTNPSYATSNSTYIYPNPDSYALTRKTDINGVQEISDQGDIFYKFKKDVYDKGYKFIKLDTSGDFTYFTFGNGSSYLHIYWSRTPMAVQFPMGESSLPYTSITDARENPLQIASYANKPTLIVGQNPVFMYSPAQIPISSFFIAPTGGTVNPSGYVSASCDVITGWTCDASDYSKALTVSFLADGIRDIGYALADKIVGDTSYQQSIALACGGFPAHNFTFVTPDILKDGRIHTITASGVNIGDGVNGGMFPNSLDNTHLTPSTQTATSITCGAPPNPLPLQRPGGPTLPPGTTVNPLPVGRSVGPTVSGIPNPLPQPR